MNTALEKGGDKGHEHGQEKHMEGEASVQLEFYGALHPLFPKPAMICVLFKVIV